MKNDTKKTATQALEQARAVTAARRAAGETVERLNPIEKAQADPKSKTKAIAGKCWDCQGGDADPGPRWRIGNCNIPHCSLYPVRPYQSQHGKPAPLALRQQFEAPTQS